MCQYQGVELMLAVSYTSEIDNLDGGILLFSNWVAALWTGSRLIGYSDIDFPQAGQVINGMPKLQSHTIRMDSRQKAIRPHLNHRYRVSPEQRNLQMLFT